MVRSCDCNKSEYSICLAGSCSQLGLLVLECWKGIFLQKSLHCLLDTGIFPNLVTQAANSVQQRLFDSPINILALLLLLIILIQISRQKFEKPIHILRWRWI